MEFDLEKDIRSRIYFKDIEEGDIDKLCEELSLTFNHFHKIKKFKNMWSFLEEHVRLYKIEKDYLDSLSKAE